MPQNTTLDELKTGECGLVKKIRSNSRFKRRLIEMGFIPESKIRVIKFAPLRDPGEYALEGYHVAIRKTEAADITMERIEV